MASDVSITFTGTEYAEAIVGGIAGYMINTGAISNCYSTGNITVQANSTSGTVSAGGIVGQSYKNSANTDPNIQFCWASGNVKVSTAKSQEVGGIAGYLSASTGSYRTAISKCVALNTTVSGSEGSVYRGRVVGRLSDAEVLNCFANREIDTSATSNQNSKDGRDVTLPTVLSWWGETAGWTMTTDSEGSEDAPWKWNNTLSRPMLWFE